MKNKLVLSSLLLGTFACASVNAVTLDEIDFSNTIETQDLLFAPVKGTTSNRGAFWYKDIKQKVIGPSNAGWGVKRITIRAFPQSHSNNVYSDFVSTNNVLDIRSNLLPDDAILCAATDALVEQLKSYGVYYNLQSNAGNYPSLCSLQLKYQANDDAQEAEIVDFINSNKVINVNYRISSTTTPAVVMDVPNIISALVSDSVLQLDVDKNQYTGDAYKVLFQSAQYSNSLYRSDQTNDTPLQFVDWKRFVNLHEFTTSAQLVIDKNIADQNVEISVPGNSDDILSVNY